MKHNGNISSKNKYTACVSIRSPDEPHKQCLLEAKINEIYCPIHLAQKHNIRYDNRNKNYEIIDNFTDYLITPDDNPIIRKININLLNDISVDRSINRSKYISKVNNTNNSNISDIDKTSTMIEQKFSTVTLNHQENEDDLQIKFLILVNDEKYYNKISKLVGPVFDDICLSEDEQDPITYDPIWILVDGVRKPASTNKYYLFSYIDQNGKIRCFTIFTMYDMIKENNCIHPITTEPINNKDIKRAKKLIRLYKREIGLFNVKNDRNSPEFRVRNRLIVLFKKFHKHSIYFEENWLLSINDCTVLYKIINETRQLISNNIASINSTLKQCDLFNRIKPTASENIDPDFKIRLKEYIVEQWEKLISISDADHNQIPIWIIASGLSFVVPEIKEKYPNLEIMMD